MNGSYYLFFSFRTLSLQQYIIRVPTYIFMVHNIILVMFIIHILKVADMTSYSSNTVHFDYRVKIRSFPVNSLFYVVPFHWNTVKESEKPTNVRCTY